jgi:hypothetical protein
LFYFAPASSLAVIAKTPSSAIFCGGTTSLPLFAARGGPGVQALILCHTHVLQQAERLEKEGSGNAKLDLIY